ncbi:tetratricopeptide repeat protein [Candidatus Lokiarchaeum ossiferum]|uniref:tetratricopeptide repeat protein n=1 Tax=Candidatus Lokiarchaeum ossiferum TaxID=2951803 RepID=UPI00352DC283
MEKFNGRINMMKSTDPTNDFFQRYHLDYWRTKAESLFFQYKNIEACKTSLDGVEFFKNSQNSEKLLKNMLTLDLHFLKFQIIEALFSLIFTLETGKEKDIWFNLSFPKEKSERNFKLYDRIANFKKKSQLDEFLHQNIRDNRQEKIFWKHVFFSNKESLSDEKLTFKNISQILWSFCKVFQDRADYNAFKHGLRCVGSSVNLSFAIEEKFGVPPPDLQNKLRPLGYAENVISFFEKQKDNNGIKIVLRSKAFSPHEDYISVIQAYQLISNIVSIRRKEPRHESYIFHNVEKAKKNYSLINFSLTQTSVKDLYIQAKKNIQDGKADDAICLLEKITQIDPKESEAIFYLGYCYLLLSSYEEAFEFFKEYIDKNYNFSREYALYYAGFCSAKMDHHKNMYNYFHQFFKCPPINDPEFLKKAKYSYGDFLVNYARSMDSNEYFKIRRILQKAMKHVTEAGKMKFEYPESWFRLGSELMEIEMYDETVNLYSTILEHIPDARGTLINLSTTYIRMNNLVEAESFIRKAIDVDPHYANSWNILGAILIKKGNLEDANDCLNTAKQFDEKGLFKLFIKNNKGILLMEKGEFTQGEAIFQSIFNDNPTDKSVIRNLLQSLMAQNVKDPNKILGLTNNTPSNIEYFFELKSRAYANAHLGNFQEAHSILDGLKQIKHKNNEKWVDLLDSKGDFFELSEDYSKAQNFWQQSLDESTQKYDFSSQTREKIERITKKLEN